MNTNLNQFDAVVIKMNDVVLRAKEVDMTDLDEVKVMKKELQKSRTSVTKMGKEMRDSANDWRKVVIAKEKELLEITVPTEEMFDKVIADEEARIEMEVRKDDLPQRKRELDALNVSMTDEEILAMSDEQFSEEKDRIITMIADKKEKDAEYAKRKKEGAEAIERAKKETEERIERERIEEEERKKEEVEAQKIAEAEDEKWQKFLKDNGYDENTDVIQYNGNNKGIYRLVAVYEK